jgi:hypothetical protein
VWRPQILRVCPLLLSLDISRSLPQPLAPPPSDKKRLPHELDVTPAAIAALSTLVPYLRELDIRNCVAVNVLPVELLKLQHLTVLHASFDTIVMPPSEITRGELLAALVWAWRMSCLHSASPSCAWPLLSPLYSLLSTPLSTLHSLSLS